VRWMELREMAFAFLFDRAYSTRVSLICVESLLQSRTVTVIILTGKVSVALDPSEILYLLPKRIDVPTRGNHETYPTNRFELPRTLGG
jgi:hypothetical protein